MKKFLLFTQDSQIFRSFFTSNFQKVNWKRKKVEGQTGRLGENQNCKLRFPIKYLLWILIFGKAQYSFEK